MLSCSLTTSCTAEAAGNEARKEEHEKCLCGDAIILKIDQVFHKDSSIGCIKKVGPEDTFTLTLHFHSSCWLTQHLEGASNPHSCIANHPSAALESDRVFDGCNIKGETILSLPWSAGPSLVFSALAPAACLLVEQAKMDIKIVLFPNIIPFL